LEVEQVASDAPSFFRPARERVKVIFCSVQYRSRWPLMNSDPLSS